MRGATQGIELVSHPLVVGKARVELDEEGFLVHLEDWNEDVALALAAKEGIAAGPEHLEIIYLLRQFHAQYQLSPAMRPLVKYVASQLGPQKGTSLYLLSLFPGSPAKLASKLAGLPKPDNCL